ncbi:MAG: aspartate/glutamate racemase family protein [Peptococcaceae bacterium]|nr:aspartate/glutamate racemase family protein [Peptococcaceae bacterium]
MKKTAVITPIASPLLDEAVRRRCREVAPADFEVEAISLTRGPLSIETIFDEEYAAAALYDWALENRREIGREYGAVVVNCFADPGVDGLRELLDLPVVGVGAAAFSLALQLAPRFSVISMQKNSLAHGLARLDKMSLGGRLASFYPLEDNLESLAEGGGYRQLLAYGKKAAAEDGADALVLGCTGMAEMAVRLQEELPLPVIEPTSAGLWAAFALQGLGLKHGRCWMYQQARPENIVRRNDN